MKQSGHRIWENITNFVHTGLHKLPQSADTALHLKTFTHTAFYNFIPELILAVFGRKVTTIISNQKLFYFPTKVVLLV